MTIIVVEKVSVSMRGELTRWMIEPKTGIFVGKITAMVRDKLWERVGEGVKTGAALLIHGADNEQGFAVRTHGQTSRLIVDFDGLSLVQIPS